MSDVVQRAKAALEGVTEGPWRWGIVDDDDEYLIDPNGYQVPTYIKENTVFIAAARSLVPELVAEVERLREGLSRIERFARQQALSDRVRSGVSYGKQRDWLDMLAIIESVQRPKEQP